MLDIYSAVPPVIRALIGAFLFALNQIMVRRLTDHTSPLTLAVMVNLSMGMVAILLSSSEEAHEGNLLWGFFIFLSVGFLGTGLGRYLTYHSSILVGVSRTSTIISLSPIGAALTAIFWLGEAPGLTLWGGTGLVVLGLMIMTTEKKTEAVPLAYFIFPLLSMVAFSFTPVLRKVGLQFVNAPLMGIAVANLAAVTVLLFTSRFLPEAQKFRVTFRAALAIFPAGLVALGAAINFWTSLRDGQLTVVAPLFRLTPVFVLVLSAFFLRGKEIITPRIVASVLVVVLGAVLVTSSR